VEASRTWSERRQRWSHESGADGGGGADVSPGADGGGAVNPVRIATVLTHRRPAETAPAIQMLLAIARDAGAVLRLDPDETRKHGLEPAPGLELNAPVRPDVDICFALGGDGTVLSGLRSYAGTGVPVFGINYGEIGFLATVDRDVAEEGLRLAFAGEFEVLALPGIRISGSAGEWLAINDVSMHRQQGNRVADLEYAVGDDEVGRVRCDGLAIATPAGSTGYNLANGGPVMAWGVEGFVVSFIAPHSLTARALVVAPTDVLAVHNRSQDESVDVTVDGRPVCALSPGEKIEARFVQHQGSLAQVAGTTFYQRLREKFGRLATMP
jgi:NAD+ kinase